MMKKLAMFALTLISVFLGIGAAGLAAAADRPSPQQWGVSNYGADITSDNGQIRLQVPPGTFSGSAKYTPMTMADFPITPPNAIWGGDPFRLQFLIDGEEGNNGTPSTLIVKYDPAALGGRSEATLQLVKQSADPSSYTVLPSTVNTTSHTVTAQVTDSGYYGLSVSNVAPTAAPTAVPTQATAPTAVPMPTQTPAPTAAPAPAPAPVPAEPPAFKLGFAALASMIPDIAGRPIENERHNPENGDGLQQTTTGLMVWRKADNWTAFTNGTRTWINGPVGLQERGNEERFDWEK